MVFEKIKKNNSSSYYQRKKVLGKRDDIFWRENQNSSQNLDPRAIFN